MQSKASRGRNPVSAIFLRIREKTGGPKQTSAEPSRKLLGRPAVPTGPTDLTEGGE